MHITEQQMRAVLEPIRTVSGIGDFARATALSFGHVFGASKAVYVERRGGIAADAPLSPDDVHFINWPAWCKTHYCRHVRHRDPIRHWLADSASPSALQGDRDVALLSDLVPTRRLLQASYYTEMMRPSDARYVMTLMVRDGDAVVGALSLVRDSHAEDFTAAERRLAHGLTPVLGMAHALAVERNARTAPPDMSRAPLSLLTPRERQVAALVVQGHPNKTIARLLDTSPWTIKNHLRAVFDKMQVHNRTALCALMRDQALTSDRLAIN